MKVKNRLAAAALMMAATGSLYAQDRVPAAPPVSTQNTSEEIRLLRARLDQLEAQQLEAAKKAGVTRTTEQMLDDANRRSQMLDVGSFSAGYKDGRFYMGSEDGNFTLKPWLHFQYRAVALNRQDFKNGGKDNETDTGFEVRRLKLGFDGNMFTPDFTYFFNWATSRASSNANVNDLTGTRSGTVSNNLGGVPILEEAWVKYHFAGTPWSVKAGQLKDPLLHDQIVSSRYQQSAERSLTADIFANGDAFTKGITVIYDPGSSFRVEAGVTDGIRSADTDFRDFPNNSSFNQFNFGAAARGEYKLMGKWKEYSQVGGVGVTEDLLVVGLGADYSERGHFHQLVGALDVMYASPSGLNLYGAIVDRYTNHNFGIYTQSSTSASIGTPGSETAGKPTNEYSFMLQGGYLINQQIEPFGRFEYMKLQGTANGSKNYIPAITGGVNYYFFGHRAKITAEVQYLPKGLPIDDGANDILSSPRGKGELLGEIQFQLLI